MERKTVKMTRPTQAAATSRYTPRPLSQQRVLSPFTTVRRMMEDMDRVFGGYSDFVGLGEGRLPEEPQGWTPQVEVFQRGENLVIRADLPGLESKDVNVELEDHAITLKGERQAEHEETKDGIFHSERSYGSFERRIPLPPGIDRNACDAVFHNGVLEVTLKLPKASPQRVQIRAGGAPPTQPETKAPMQTTQQSAGAPQPPSQNGTARN